LDQHKPHHPQPIGLYLRIKDEEKKQIKDTDEASQRIWLFRCFRVPYFNMHPLRKPGAFVQSQHNDALLSLHLDQRFG
jgi:hypothetical protein